MDRPVTGSARERDTTAIVRAATELFAERGPAATSLREVAARAGVNYGLIHQYIGNKDDLVRLVARRVSVETAERFAAVGSVGDVLDQLLRPSPTPSPYVRMLARALLDGHDPSELLGPSPALEEMIRQLVVHTPDADPAEAAATVAALMSMLMGWQLFGSFLQHAAGLGEQSPDAVAGQVLDRAHRVLGTSQPPEPSGGS